jgi:16S rRNA processing protein RimM
MPAESSERSPAATSERLVVALVRGVHGLRGALRIEILTDRPEERYRVGAVLYVEGSDEPLTIAWSAAVADGPGWRVQFAGMRDRTAAEALIGSYLEIDAGPDASLPRGSYFWHEVIGATVTSTDGANLGTVRDVYRSGGAEVYIVDGGPYGEFDVPGVRDFVRIFAPKRGEIVVDVAALDLTPPKARPSIADMTRPRGPRRRPGPRRARSTVEGGAAQVSDAGAAEAAEPPDAADRGATHVSDDGERPA